MPADIAKCPGEGKITTPRPLSRWEPPLPEDFKKTKNDHNTVITPNKMNGNSLKVPNTVFVFDFLQFSQNSLFTVGLFESGSNQRSHVDLADTPPNL